METNPGPTRKAKYPCTVCNRAVTRSDRGILCDKCSLWTHADCCQVNPEQYEQLAALGDTDTWLCPACCFSALPYTDCSHLSSTNISGVNPVNTSIFLLETSDSAYRSPSARGLSCTLLNARSIVNKTLDLHALLTNDHLDLVAVTETFLSDDVNNSELVDCSKHRVFRRDRDRHGRGVMVIVNSNLPAVRREDFETECEIIWIELMRRKMPILFGVFYRPPNTAANLSQLRCSL